jgi:hypothetical protein
MPTFNQDNTITLFAPFELKGIPQGHKVRILRIDSESATLKQRLPRDREVLELTLSREEFSQRKESRLHIRGRAYMVFLAPAMHSEFVTEGPPVRHLIPGVGECTVARIPKPSFSCSTPFRRPPDTLFQLWSGGGQPRVEMALPAQLDSLSPLPFELTIWPTRGFTASTRPIDYSAEISASEEKHWSRITLDTWRPVAFVTQDLDLTGEPLGRYPSGSFFAP